jgi:hypothetical protein
MFLALYAGVSKSASFNDKPHSQTGKSIRGLRDRRQRKREKGSDHNGSLDKCNHINHTVHLEGIGNRKQHVLVDNQEDMAIWCTFKNSLWCRN